MWSFAKKSPCARPCALPLLCAQGPTGLCKERSHTRVEHKVTEPCAWEWSCTRAAAPGSCTKSAAAVFAVAASVAYDRGAQEERCAQGRPQGRQALCREGCAHKVEVDLVHSLVRTQGPTALCKGGGRTRCAQRAQKVCDGNSREHS